MHGVKRATQKQSAEARAAKKAHEAKQLQYLRSVETRVYELRSQCAQATSLNRSRAETALEATRELLGINPEMATAWNFRRQAMIEVLVDEYLSHAEHSVPLESADQQQTITHPLDQRAVAQMRMLQALLFDTDIDLTATALRAHPKVYWIWNHRRWCLQLYPSPTQLAVAQAVLRGTPIPSTDADEEEVKGDAGRELDRERVQGGKWAREIKLVEGMLELDPRNFHGWNYRRYVLAHLAGQMAPGSRTVSSELSTAPGSTAPASESTTSNPLLPSLPLPPEVRTALTTPPSPPPFPAQIPPSLLDKELAYTQRMIEQNFSNFSAWHQRQIVLRHRWNVAGTTAPHERAGTDPDTASNVANAVDLAHELDLLQQAMYTDPSDGSIWQHHRWIVESKLATLPSKDTSVLDHEIDSLGELLELEPDAIRTLFLTPLFPPLKRICRLCIGPPGPPSKRRRTSGVGRGWEN